MALLALLRSSFNSSGSTTLSINAITLAVRNDVGSDGCVIPKAKARPASWATFAALTVFTDSAYHSAYGL